MVTRNIYHIKLLEKSTQITRGFGNRGFVIPSDIRRRTVINCVVILALIKVVLSYFGLKKELLRYY